MPKAHKAKASAAHGKARQFDVPQGKKMKKDLGVPKFAGLKEAVAQNRMQRTMPAAPPTMDLELDQPADTTAFTPEFVDPALTTRDSSARAFTRELKKVIERSDVVLQVLDARDPEGTRSRWVEDEVRRREGEGKKLIAVVNKIDLVPRANLEAWIKHLRHSFPTMPFKASTQAQRSNLSQSTVQILPTAAAPTTHASLPSTSASLGAPALLHLLKQYAQTRPHQTLTVGVIGYPNVGKSSLINSLKRSRACAVAAMPGKTRVVQEIVLDKGVKILDCPGVVLEDFGSQEGSEEERRKRRGDVMLRNCLKIEEIEDKIAPVDAILSKVDPARMQAIYAVPPYEDVTRFLVAVALTKGRLGRGGIPDLEAAATQVLRDWNAGKIPYHTTPPLVHPSARPSAVSAPLGPGGISAGTGMEVDAAVNEGDAILSGLGQAFDLDGLFETGGELKEGDEWRPAVEPAGVVPITEDIALPPVPRLFPDTPAHNPAQSGTASRLFTPAELEMLPNNPLDRKAQRKDAKRRAKLAREHAEQTMDLDGLSLAVGIAPEPVAPRVKKLKKKEKSQTARGTLPPVKVSEEAEKEMEFMAFLNHVGADAADEDSMEWDA